MITIEAKVKVGDTKQTIKLPVYDDPEKLGCNTLFDFYMIWKEFVDDLKKIDQARLVSLYDTSLKDFTYGDIIDLSGASDFILKWREKLVFGSTIYAILYLVQTFGLENIISVKINTKNGGLR